MATMSLQAAYDQARSYLEANKVEQATGVAQHILEYFPENLEAHRILGEAYLAGRQFDQAEAAFSRVLHADPENIPAHVGLGITFERQGKLDRAVAEFEQALEVRPEMPELRTQLLRLYTDIWGSEGATLRLSRPGLARLYAKGHMLPQAIQEFRSVIEELPDRYDARVGLAEALWRDNQEQAALEACEDILAQRSDVLKANLLLGYIKLANSDESGEPYWRLAQQLDPYQGVARALFESLPDIPGPDLNLPAWDEGAWAARREREASERRTTELPAVELADQPAFTATAGAAAAASADDLFSDSWLDEPIETPEPVPQPAAASFAPEDDDFLATLLALETPPLPTTEGSDLDSTSGVTPFSFDDFGFDATPQPAPSAAPAAEPEPEPFSLSDLGLSDEEIAELNSVDVGATEQDRDQPAPATSPSEDDAGLASLSLEDLGLSDADLQPQAAEQREESFEPFSLEDLGLDDDLGQQATPSQQSEPALEPFSLEDLGLSEEEIAQLNATTPTPEPSAQQPESALAPDEPTLEPFSLEELGLSADEIAELNAGSPAAEPPAPAFDADFPEIDPGLEPFSLEELGLSEDEIAQLNSAPPAPPTPRAEPAREDELADLAPFDWGVADTPAPAAQGPAAEDIDLGELTPFSLDDLDLDTSADPNASSLPPALQAFSLDEALSSGQTAELPADEPDESNEAGGYSWQQPSAKPQTDFARQGEQDVGKGSIFGRLRQAAADRPPEEPEPLAPVSDEEVADAGYFSNDDVSLRLEDPGAAERFTGSFRLPKDEPGAEAPPADAAPLAEEPVPPTSGEPELKPFSLAELGLSPEEIAQLEATEQNLAVPETPPASGEPELKPFSLAELGLSPEEIAQLEAANAGDAPIPATGDTIVPGWSRGEEPELTPFSLDDLGFDEATAEPAAEAPSAGLEAVEPFSLDDLGFDLDDAGAQRSSAAENPSDELGSIEPFSFDDFGLDSGTSDDLGASGVQPFSLDDLGLGDFDAPAAADRNRELGLTAEELAGLDLGELESIADTPPMPIAEDPDAAFERLMGLGQSQGFVDLTDIIAVVSDPEEEADRIEEIGWALHRAGIEIRDGDEVIDMEEGEGEGEIEAAPAAEEPAFTAPDLGSDAEPDLTPFSLEELGLSPEEIAALGLGDAAATPPAAPVEEMPAEPELTPFSLEELGLSPEEIAQLNAGQAEEATAEAPAAEAPAGEPELTPFSLEELGLSPEEIAQLNAAPSEAPAAETAGDDMFDFDVTDLPPVEKVTKRSEPRVEEPPPPVNPADSAFTAEPLDSLDDIWQTPPPPAPSEPARVVLPPMGERPQPRREPAPRASTPPREPQPSRPTTWARSDAPGTRTSTRGREEDRYARRDALSPRPAGPPPVAARHFSDFVPTGDEGLDEVLNQLESEPENYGLAMAIGRLSAQTGRADLMTMAYRSLIKEGMGIDEIAEELEGLVGSVDDTSVQRQLYRLLGDTYSRQGRLREAMAAYGYTFGR